MKTPTSAPDFQFIAGSLALDFVNTVGDRLGRSRDYFRGGAELTQWARLAKLLPVRESIRPTTRQLAHIRTVREDLPQASRCHALLVQAQPLKLPVIAPEWSESWRGSRTGDRNELFILYRR